AVKADEAKTAHLEETLEHLRAKLPDDARGDAVRFVRRYYEHVAEDDLLERSVLDLYGAALAQWNLIQERRPSETKVHVYNPRFEEHGWASTHTVIEIVGDDMPFLVDSVGMELTRRGSAIHLFIHP